MCSSQNPTHKIPDAMAKTWRGVCCPPLGCRTTPLLTPGLWGVTSGYEPMKYMQMDGETVSVNLDDF